MIDNELDQLSRALIAATDRLNSQDFQDRQANYLRLEQEASELATQLEAEERAVEKAQDALQRYVAVTYLNAADEPTESDDALFESDPVPAYAEQGDDEFSTPRAAGALND